MRKITMWRIVTMWLYNLRVRVAEGTGKGFSGARIET
jgi:hypothetical protein